MVQIFFSEFLGPMKLTENSSKHILPPTLNGDQELSCCTHNMLFLMYDFRFFIITIMILFIRKMAALTEGHLPADLETILKRAKNSSIMKSKINSGWYFSLGLGFNLSHLLFHFISCLCLYFIVTGVFA